MKPRIKTDVVVLGLFFFFALAFLLFPKTYLTNTMLDNILDFLGFLSIFKGTLLRMIARGHKKEFSNQGNMLVTSGPYNFVRNPMYLGTFLIGCGFVLVLCPWWFVPIFATIFYARFIRQIMKEEGLLEKNFGQGYKDYCQRVPRLFPRFRILNNDDLKRNFPLKEAFNTQEAKGLWGWIFLALITELAKEALIFGNTNFSNTLLVFFLSGVVMIVVFYHLRSQEG